MAVVRAVLIGIWFLVFGVVSLVLERLPRGAGALAAVRLSRLFCRVTLRLLRIRVVATCHGTSGGRLVVANHISWADILVLGSREPLCFLAKSEVGSWPIVASIARVHGTVFLDRRRRRDIPVANRAMAERLREGRSMLLFPEGTTNDGLRPGRFLTSHLACLRDRMAAEPGLERCAVQTVALAYSDAAAAWVGDATLVPHVWAILTGPPITCTVADGEMRDVERGFDRKRLGTVLAAEVERLLHGAAAPRPPAETRRSSAARPVLGAEA